MSPFSGTFTIGLILSLSLTWVYFYLESRKDAAILARRATAWGGWLRFIAAGYGSSPGAEARHRRSSLALAAIILAVGVAAASSSGFVFGMQGARPGWFGALHAPGFVTLAAVTATGMLLIIAAVLRKVLAEGDRLDMRVFGWLSNLLTGLTLAYIYFLPAELITAGYGARLAESRITEEMLTDHYAWMFWLSGASFVAAFAIGGTQALRRRHSLPLILVAAVLVNVAAMIKRCLIVVPSLTHGNLLPYPTGSYGPTWVEYSVIVGLVALAALLYVMFMKVFPIMDVQEEN
jgi:molybdopterin-containing oxidoreductase family membrane subunit